MNTSYTRTLSKVFYRILKRREPMVHVIYLLKFFINTEPHVKENENKFFFYEEILKNFTFWLTDMVTHSSHKHLALPQCDIQVKWLARFIPDSTHRKIIHA